LSRDDFYTPTDTDVLRMENELLVFEVRFLKAQLSASEAERQRPAARFKRQLEETRTRLEETRTRLEERENQLARAKRAEQDIVSLLGLLANSPFSWFFGLKQSFRVLERRYLDTDA